MGVAEGEHKYGADAFEAAVKAGRVDVGDKKGDNLMKSLRRRDRDGIDERNLVRIAALSRDDN